MTGLVRGARRRTALRSVTVLVVALATAAVPQAAQAAAAEANVVGVRMGPEKLDCRNWGQAAVRNWLTGRCPTPAGIDTYRTWIPGGGGTWIRGLRKGDGCSGSPDRPMGKFDFRPACDMHDYGFSLMDSGALRKSQGNLDAINGWFVTVLEYGVCGSFRGTERLRCRSIARQYGYGVAVLGPWVASLPGVEVTSMPGLSVPPR